MTGIIRREFWEHVHGYWTDGGQDRRGFYVSISLPFASHFVFSVDIFAVLLQGWLVGSALLHYQYGVLGCFLDLCRGAYSKREREKREGRREGFNSFLSIPSNHLSQMPVFIYTLCLLFSVKETKSLLFCA